MDRDVLRTIPVYCWSSSSSPPASSGIMLTTDITHVSIYDMHAGVKISSLLSTFQQRNFCFLSPAQPSKQFENRSLASCSAYSEPEHLFHISLIERSFEICATHPPQWSLYRRPTAAMQTASMLSPGKAEYLEAFYAFQESGDTLTCPVLPEQLLLICWNPYSHGSRR